MSGIVRYRIQPVGVDVPEEVGADDLKAARRGIRVFQSLEDLWQALLSDDGAEWQPEIVAVEGKPASRPDRGQQGPAGVQGSGVAGRRSVSGGRKAAERVVRRCRFESWDEMRQIARRIHGGETSVEDRLRLSWSMPVVTDQAMRDAEARRRRACAPIPANEVQGWMDRVIQCLICGREHSRAAGCDKDVLGAINLARAADDAPAPRGGSRSCQPPLVEGRSRRRKR